MHVDENRGEKDQKIGRGDVITNAIGNVGVCNEDVSDTVKFG